MAAPAAEGDVSAHIMEALREIPSKKRRDLCVALKIPGAWDLYAEPQLEALEDLQLSWDRLAGAISWLEAGGHITTKRDARQRFVDNGACMHRAIVDRHPSLASLFEQTLETAQGAARQAARQEDEKRKAYVRNRIEQDKAWESALEELDDAARERERHAYVRVHGSDAGFESHLADLRRRPLIEYDPDDPFFGDFIGATDEVEGGAEGEGREEDSAYVPLMESHVLRAIPLLGVNVVALCPNKNFDPPTGKQVMKGSRILIFKEAELVRGGMTNFSKGWSPWHADQDSSVNGTVKQFGRPTTQRDIQRHKRTLLTQSGLTYGLLKGKICYVDSNADDAVVDRVRLSGKVLRYLSGLGSALYGLDAGDLSEDTMEERLDKLRSFKSDDECEEFVKKRVDRHGPTRPAGGGRERLDQEDDDISKCTSHKERMCFKVRYILRNLTTVLRSIAFMKDFLCDPENGFLRTYRDIYEQVRMEALAKAMAPIKELAKAGDEVEGKAAAVDCLKQVQKGAGKAQGGICYVQTQTVLESLEEKFAGYAGDQGTDLGSSQKCAIESILRSIVCRSLTATGASADGEGGMGRDEERIRALLDLILKVNNREFKAGGQDGLTVKVKVQGTPPASRALVEERACLLTPIKGFTQRLNNQVNSEDMLAMSKVMASSDGDEGGSYFGDKCNSLTELKIDNYFREQKAKGASAGTEGGPFGQMSSSNFAGRSIALGQSLGTAMRAYGADLSGVKMYNDEMWGAANRNRVKELVLSVCSGGVAPEQGQNALRGNIFAILSSNMDLSETDRARSKDLLSFASGRDAFERVRIAFDKDEDHGQVCEGTSPPATLSYVRGLLPMGLCNINSSSIEGCYEILRRILTHPLVRARLCLGLPVIISGDIALYKNFLQLDIGGLHPQGISPLVLFLPDIFLHPFAKCMDCVWELFHEVIKPLWEAGVRAMDVFGNKMLDTRLAPGQGWCEFFWAAYLGGSSDVTQETMTPRRQLLLLSAKHPSDAGIVVAMQFFECYLPLLILYSRVYAMCRDEDIEKRRLSFDLLRLVILPSLSLAFGALGSTQYRDYCTWCELLFEHWRNTERLKWLYDVARDHPAELLCGLDIENLHADYSRTMRAGYMGETEIENTRDCAFMLGTMRDIGAGGGRGSGQRQRHSSKFDVTVSAITAAEEFMFERLGQVAEGPEAVTVKVQQREGKKTTALGLHHPHLGYLSPRMFPVEASVAEELLGGMLDGWLRQVRTHDVTAGILEVQGRSWECATQILPRHFGGIGEGAGYTRMIRSGKAKARTTQQRKDAMRIVLTKCRDVNVADAVRGGLRKLVAALSMCLGKAPSVLSGGRGGAPDDAETCRKIAARYEGIAEGSGSSGEDTTDCEGAMGKIDLGRKACAVLRSQAEGGDDRDIVPFALGVDSSATRRILEEALREKGRQLASVVSLYILDSEQAHEVFEGNVGDGLVEGQNDSELRSLVVSCVNRLHGELCRVVGAVADRAVVLLNRLDFSQAVLCAADAIQRGRGAGAQDLCGGTANFSNEGYFQCAIGAAEIARGRFLCEMGQAVAGLAALVRADTALRLARQSQGSGLGLCLPLQTLEKLRDEVRNLADPGSGGAAAGGAGV